uniref:Uncharacterized protein n=1 Tax=Panagrolaimus sp. ES5 TaxID=591445 RepID=A0AC34GGA8_9BILA
MRDHKRDGRPAGKLNTLTVVHPSDRHPAKDSYWQHKISKAKQMHASMQGEENGIFAEDRKRFLKQKTDAKFGKLQSTKSKTFHISDRHKFPNEVGKENSKALRQNYSIHAAKPQVAKATKGGRINRGRRADKKEGPVYSNYISYCSFV